MSRRSSGPRRGSSSLLKAGHSHRKLSLSKRLLRFGLFFLSIAVVLGLMAGATLLYLQFKVKGGDTVVEGLEKQAVSEPMNVLVLGSDSRDDLTEEQRISFGTIEGRRADTIMLLQLDEQRDKVVLVHFPRDLSVKDPEGKEVKLNSIYGLGADAVVSTVSKFTGLPIHHYVEVDFNGFNQITRELGGVQVFFEKALKDRDSGLNVPRGCVTIEGDQALAFVRARKIDDDFGRIRRQQLFLKLMIDKIADPGTLLRPDKVLSLVNVLSNNVKYDAELTLRDIQRIGLRVRGFSSGNLDLRVVPSSPARIQGVEYVLANEQQSQALFKAMAAREALPPFGRTGVSAVVPDDVRLGLLNGTNVEKLAANEADLLKSKGFQVLVDGNAPEHELSTIYFDDGYEEQARLVATVYPARLEPKPPTIVSQAPVALVLGRDFAATKAPPVAPGAGTVSSPVPPPVVPQPPPPAKQADVRPCATQ